MLTMMSDGEVVCMDENPQNPQSISENKNNADIVANNKNVDCSFLVNSN
jgi:hypothetical protein